MPFERIEELDIFVDCRGVGPPSLVFVHGFGCSAEDWQPQVERLADRFRCITLDLPGHGRSQLPPLGDVQQLARILCAVKTLYGGTRTVFVGHSLGCRVILNAMSRCADGIAGLVLIEQNLVAEADAEAVVNTLQARIRQVGFRDFLRATFAAMFSSESDAALRETVLSRLDRLDPRFAQELLASALRWESQTAIQLAGITVPVLLLQSTYLDERFEWHRLEAGMTTAWIRTVLDRVPGAEFRLIPGAGHFAQIDAAAQVSECIGIFAGSLS